MRPHISRSSIGKLYAAVLISAMTFFAAGCSKNSSTNPMISPGGASVQGDVIGGPGLMRAGHQQYFAPNSSSVPHDPPAGGVEGATVSLAQVQVDGSLKTVSTGSVKTDATGHFSINTDLNDVSDLVAVATEGSTQWEAMISGQVASGNAVECQPLTNQTTVAAQAYSRIVADGKSNGLTTSDLQVFVSPSVAASVTGNSSAIASLAAAIEDEETAQSTAFSQFSISAAQLAMATTAREQAQVELESALYSAAGDSSKDNSALGTYSATTIGAYIAAANIPVEVLAKTEEIACSSLVSSSASMSAGAQFSIEQSADLIRAGLIGEVIVTELEAGGATQSEVASADSADAGLLTAINLAISSGDLATAFANYHFAIMAQLQAMSGTGGSAVARADNDLNITGGPHATLENALVAASTSGAVVQAYMTFYASVGTMMQGVGGMSGAQLDAATQILMLVDSN